MLSYLDFVFDISGDVPDVQPVEREWPSGLCRRPPRDAHPQPALLPRAQEGRPRRPPSGVGLCPRDLARRRMHFGLRQPPRHPELIVFEGNEALHPQHLVAGGTAVDDDTDPLHSRPGSGLVRVSHSAGLEVDSSGAHVHPVAAPPEEVHGGLGDGLGDHSGTLEAVETLREASRGHSAAVEAGEGAAGGARGGRELRRREVACRVARVERAEAAAALVAALGRARRPAVALAADELEEEEGEERREASPLHVARRSPPPPHHRFSNTPLRHPLARFPVSCAHFLSLSYTLLHSNSYARAPSRFVNVQC